MCSLLAAIWGSGRLLQKESLKIDFHLVNGAESKYKRILHILPAAQDQRFQLELIFVRKHK